LATARKGSAVKKGLKFFIYGSYGTWKSSFALDFIRMKNENGNPLKVLFIDCETGSVDNYIEDYQEKYNIDPENILMVYTTSYQEVEEYALTAINNEPIFIEDENGDLIEAKDAEGNTFIADVIIIDGITVIQDNVKFAAINVSEKRARLRVSQKESATETEKFVAEATAGLEFKDHDKIKMKGKNLLRKLITGTDKYVIVTSREKQKKEMVKNDKGDMQLVTLGVVPDCWDGAEHEFYTVLRHFEDDEGNIKAQVMRKDRTGVFKQNEIIERPTPLYWQQVIDKNRNKKNNTVLKETMEDSIKKDEQTIIGNNNPINEKTKVEEVNEPNTKEEFLEAINKSKKTLSPSNRKAIKPKLENANLPLSDYENASLEELKQVYEIIKNI
jgi:hypothetical protein